MGTSKISPQPIGRTCATATAGERPRRRSPVRGLLPWLARAIALVAGVPAGNAADFAFDGTVIDGAYGGSGGPGWVQVGDVDNDCAPEIVVGGGGGLFVYQQNPAGAWTKSRNLDSTYQMGCNGAVLYDVDADGDLDVVAARYESDLGWWENPGTLTYSWTFHALLTGVNGWFLHDLIRADLDRDGVAAEFIAVLHLGYWDAPVRVYWLRPYSNPHAWWQRETIAQDQPGPNNNHAGVDVGDIDGDGDVDIAFSNGWFASPGDPTGTWTWRPVTSIYGISNTLVRDINGDGKLDLVISAGHHGQGVYWLQNPGNPVTGSWVQRNISGTVGSVTARHYYGNETDAHLHHPEGLQVADVDRDGDLDVLVSELYFGEDPGEPAWTDDAHNLYVFENRGGSPPAWRRQTLAAEGKPHHLPHLADLNGDRRLDVVSQGAAAPVVSLLENFTPPLPPFRQGGDIDCDGDIDLDDLQAFNACSSGPGRWPFPGPPLTRAVCLDVFDLDDDNDVDLMDFLPLSSQSHR